ncbi:putative RmlC-like cupins superfamily protein [Hibiscus syriacus]|uniref:RmlC-like cupins superfamily protein n=1 Tax=Hibiscus syriacus TaxID=106335 RepID=A0A6A3BVM2_HIBSY|nr:putative RmlC-like cupins superfamily protein [Hibiscus syriacus]
MERSVMSSSLLVLACLVGSGAAQSTHTAYAHWVDFFAKENNWDMNKANDLDSDGQGQVVGHLVVNYRFVDCDATPVGSGEFNVRADCSLDYKPIENNWVYPSHADCAAKDGGKPLEWRKRYGWTGYCGKFNTSNPVDNCGKCLKVLNRYTKDSITVRIIDTCGGEAEAMVLDCETAFKPIDTDGKGYEAGHLNVVYLFVECDDDVLVYSQ